MELHAGLSRGQLIAAILELAETRGRPMSPSKAGRLAAKIQRGDFSDDLTPVLQYRDTTGETACNNVLLS